jgi:RimJ/RimL family protein N-acetyltransferase
MIDGGHRGKGYGYRAMELIIEHVRSRPNATEITTAHDVSDGHAGEFYKKLGFGYTGEKEQRELVMRLVL